MFDLIGYKILGMDLNRPKTQARTPGHALLLSASPISIVSLAPLFCLCLSRVIHLLSFGLSPYLHRTTRHVRESL